MSGGGPQVTEDDREAFAADARAKALSMAKDPEVARLDRELTIVSDRHDYSYMWRWLGLPIIQMPADIVATQEVIWDLRPQVIIETGVARGGSAIFHASLLELLGEGKVVAVDIDIRAHNRRALEQHPLFHRIKLIEGSSVDPDILRKVGEEIGGAERVMVVLDSDHSHKHVLDELRAYGPMVTPGQFMIVADTLIEDIPPQVHRPGSWGPEDNPATAIRAYMDERPGMFEPDDYVNGKLLLTSSRGGYLRRQ